MPAKSRAQINMEDTVINDPDLEQMLEERQELKESVSEYQKLDKNVKARLRAIETPTPYRVGRFVITMTENHARTIAFETQGSFTFRVKLAGEE